MESLPPNVTVPPIEILPPIETLPPKLADPPALIPPNEVPESPVVPEKLGSSSPVPEVAPVEAPELLEPSPGEMMGVVGGLASPPWATGGG